MEQNSLNSFNSVMNEKRLIFFLTFILLLSGMATDIYIPSMPKIKLELATTNSLVSFTITVFIISSSVMALFVSMLADKYGRKKLLWYANVVFVISVFVAAIAPDIYTVIAMRTVQGVACAFNFIITRMIIKDLFEPKKQVTINSIVFTAFAVSPGVAPVVGSIIIKYLSWRWCFVFEGVCLLFMLYEIKHFLVETLPRKKELPKPLVFLGNYIVYFSTKNFNGAVFISAFAYAGYFVYLTVSSFILINTLGLTAQSYAFIFVFLASFFIFGNYLMRLLNKGDIEHEKILLIGVLLNVAGAVLVGIAYLNINYRILAVLLIVMGAVIMRFGLGFILALVQIMAMNEFKKSSGQALGILNFCQCAISAIAAIWASTFIGNLLLGLFVTAITFSSISLLLYFFIYKLSIKFPNLKYRFLRKSVNKYKFKKF